MPRFPLSGGGGGGTVYTVTTGTFVLVNNANEQDCLIFAAANQLIDIELDMVNLTQLNTIRQYEQVDGANYRQIAAWTFPTQFDAGTLTVDISFAQENALYKVTLQAIVAEGAVRNIPYRHMTRV